MQVNGAFDVASGVAFDVASGVALGVAFDAVIEVFLPPL